MDQFSATHQGWLVSLELLSPDLGAQPQIHDLPLRGVSTEPQADGAVVVVSAGTVNGGDVSHVIQHVTCMRIEQTDERADVAVEVESADGTVNLLRLTSPALPETVDGMARGEV
jgi:hypothetical protein